MDRRRHARCMGVFGILYGLSPNIEVAILMVMITGFLNSPMSIARAALLQKNIPRAMRGRVFSAFSVSRDVVFLIGMAGAGARRHLSTSAA